MWICGYPIASLLLAYCAAYYVPARQNRCMSLGDSDSPGLILSIALVRETPVQTKTSFHSHAYCDPRRSHSPSARRPQYPIRHSLRELTQRVVAPATAASIRASTLSGTKQATGTCGTASCPCFLLADA